MPERKIPKPRPKISQKYLSCACGLSVQTPRRARGGSTCFQAAATTISGEIRWSGKPTSQTTGALSYESAYAGIDLVYFGAQGEIEHDFIVAPGANPHAIAFEIMEDGFGSNRGHPPQVSLRFDSKGDLLITTDAGEVRLHQPVGYQELSAASSRQSPQVSNSQSPFLNPGFANQRSQSGNYESVEGRFVLLARNRVGFEVGSYDKTRPLVIDPVLSCATYMRIEGDRVANGIAVDPTGAAIIVGTRSSGPVITMYKNAFATKVNPQSDGVLFNSKYPPAEPGALGCEPLKAAMRRR